jgi:hypothetical protein
MKLDWRRLSTILIMIITLLVAMTPPAGAASMKIWNAHQYRCLRVNGTNVVAASCTDEPQSHWLFQRNSDNANSYYIVSTVGAANMCLTQDPAPSVATVYISWCSGSLSQSWNVDFAGTANTLTSLHSGRCLERVGTSQTVGTFGCNGSLTQQWYNG